MIRTYKKMPVEIQAIQFEDTLKCLKELSDFMGPITVDYKEHAPQLIIHTLEGDHRANVGDYIIKGVMGEFYPCRKDIFETTYKELERPICDCEPYEIAKTSTL